MLHDQLTIITSPELGGVGEAVWITTLLRLGVGWVHIRKPEARAEELAPLLEAIPRELRRRCILSYHPELATAYALGGIHLAVREWSTLDGRPEVIPSWMRVGVSCHNEAELAALPFVPSYAYLSPVAPSCSKPGYGKNQAWTDEALRGLCRETPFPLVALGGVCAENADSFLRLGFAGVASLGYWQGLPLAELEGALARFCPPRILLCGGLDPTAEAGITADVRHAERLGARVMTLVTALTSQDAKTFTRLTPVASEDLDEGLVSLRHQASPAVAKIGLVASQDQVLQLCRGIRQLFPQCLILWDPILRTSSGYQVMSVADRATYEEAIHAVDFLLPNASEQAVLFHASDPASLAKRWGTSLICKSHQRRGATVIDVAYLPDGQRVEVAAPLGGEDRHGTGCLYATELAVALARGEALAGAMARAQRAVTCLRHGHPLPTPPRRARLGRRMFITHGATPQEILCQTARVLSATEADIIQLRMKQADEATFLATAREVLALCRSYGVPLLINDCVDICLAVGADGVHLGPDDLPPRQARQLLGAEALIGLTCHNRAELDAALRQPIDYVGLGPYRYTKTKEKLAPILGLEGYYQLQLDRYPLPVYAIGGIRPEEAPRLLATGVYGLAMSSGLLQALDRS